MKHVYISPNICHVIKMVARTFIPSSAESSATIPSINVMQPASINATPSPSASINHHTFTISLKPSSVPSCSAK